MLEVGFACCWDVKQPRKKQAFCVFLSFSRINLFLLYLYEYHMDLYNELCIGHHMQTVQPNLFIPAMLKGTVSFDHFMLNSLTLTLPDKVSEKHNLLTSFSCTLSI